MQPCAGIVLSHASRADINVRCLRIHIPAAYLPATGNSGPSPPACCPAKNQFESFHKRLIKAPKLHFVDVGLLAFLLGIRSSAELEIHARRGDLFENFVAAELLKAKYHAAGAGDLFFWRDKSGHEIDLLIESGPRRIPIEVKSGQTVQPDFFRSLDYWRRISGAVERGRLVYAGDTRQVRSEHTVHPWSELAAPEQLLA